MKNPFKKQWQLSTTTGTDTQILRFRKARRKARGQSKKIKDIIIIEKAPTPAK